MSTDAVGTFDAAASTAYVGLGANLGDPGTTLASACRALGALESTRLVRVSGLYRSASMGATGPDYLNAVAVLRTRLPPTELLAALHRIESAYGRERSYRNAPRTLDLDLLVYDALSLTTPELTLPHPRLHVRAFVLRPLAEVAPNLQIPGLGPLEPLLAAVASQAVDKL